MSLDSKAAHHRVVIVGGGQAGLSLSWYLTRSGVDHVVLEKARAGHAWRAERWDTFCLVTPNWQCELPGFPYRGNDPHGFMSREEIIDYFDGFVASFDPPLREGVAVSALRRDADGFTLETTAGTVTADQVVIATGGYQIPIVPRCAERLGSDVVQLHSSQYRNPQQLPEGAVLVVGSGQSGCQIAEDLHLAGRRTYLCVGDAPRVARRYRGKDVVEWLHHMGYYDMPVDEHPLREGVRDKTNHYVTGRDGGRDIDLRQRALEGLGLYGRLNDVRGDHIICAEDLAACLDAADKVSDSIKASIDAYIARSSIAAPVEPPYRPVWTPPQERAVLDYRAVGITSVIWCVGFHMDQAWIDLPIFNGRGQPVHVRGVTPVSGVYFLGLPWLHTWGSGRFYGIARDAAYLAEQISAHGSGQHDYLSTHEEAVGGA